MTIRELLKKHHEYCNPCDVQGGPADEFVVTCRGCGAQLHAALLSPCVGGGQDQRVLLFMECPRCGSTGQLRFQRDAFGRLPPPVPPTASSVMTVAASGPGYLSVRCSSCHPGSGRGVLYQRHSVTEEELVIEGVSLGCGHHVELRLPRTSSFRFEEHRHGATPARRGRAHASL